MKYQKPVNFICDYCSKKCSEEFSHFKKSKRHFCNRECYSKFREEFLLPEEHSNWKGGISNDKHYISWLKNKRNRIPKIGNHTFGEWEILKAQYNWICPCCKKSEPEIKLTEDHIIPLSKGGSDNIENIQPLCRSCNSRKYNKVIKYNREV